MHIYNIHVYLHNRHISAYIYINHCKNMYIYLSTQEIMLSSKNNILLVTSYIQLLIMKKEKNISFLCVCFTIHVSQQLLLTHQHSKNSKSTQYYPDSLCISYLYMAFFLHIVLLSFKDLLIIFKLFFYDYLYSFSFLP